MTKAEKTTYETAELRVPDCPGDVRELIDKYISITHVNEGRRLLKGEAVIELVRIATKKLKIS